MNETKILAEDLIAESLIPSLPFYAFLRPVVHHYQVLTIIVIACIWLMNNNLSDIESYSFMSGKTSFFADDDFSYHFMKRKASVKGFFLGLLMTTGAIIVIFLQDLHLSLICHTALQVRKEHYDDYDEPTQICFPILDMTQTHSCPELFFMFDSFASNQVSGVFFPYKNR